MSTLDEVIFYKKVADRLKSRCGRLGLLNPKYNLLSEDESNRFLNLSVHNSCKLTKNVEENKVLVREAKAEHCNTILFKYNEFRKIANEFNLKYLCYAKIWISSELIFNIKTFCFVWDSQALFNHEKELKRMVKFEHQYPDGKHYKKFGKSDFTKLIDFILEGKCN